MGFRVAEFQDRVGLRYDAQSKMFFGRYDNYDVYIQMLDKSQGLLFRLAGRQPADSEMNPNAWFTMWETQQSGIAAVSFEKATLQARIQFSKKETEENAAANVAALVAAAHEVGLEPCCMACGDDLRLSAPYLVQGVGASLCNACVSDLSNHLEEQRETKSSKRANPIGTVIGIVIAAVFIFGFTFLLWQANFISFMGGYLGLLIGVLCIRKFGGKMSKIGAVLCAVICIATAFFAPAFCMAQDISKTFAESVESGEFDADEMQEALDTVTADLAIYDDDELMEIYGLSRSEMKQLLEQGKENSWLIGEHTKLMPTLKDLPQILKHDDLAKPRRELIKDILLTVLSVIVAALMLLPGTVKDDRGDYELRRLDA